MNISGTAVALADGEASAKLNAGGNYWGTTDTAVIDAMIYDRSDSSAVVGLINYQPILAAPHPDTPDIARPDAPQIDPVTTPTDSAAQTISGTKPADTSVWLNGEEVAALSADTLWSYSFALLLGENNISVTVKDQSGEASPPATTVILRVEAVCASWTYSDWSACADGVQSRTVLTSAPAGCAGGAPVLSQSCSAGILEDVVLEEKNLVKTVSSGLSSRLSGRILLQVERSGEAWYVYPADKKKYYLGRPADAFNVMRRLGLGATHGFISGQTIFPSHVLGKILLDVEKNGEAYYINPGDKKAYYLGRPLDAFRLMRELGLGITNADIRQISVGNIN
ncbi:MAG: hypothetical protein MUC28_03135 [Planctomycetes bacterium]|nr:hypothetical protein [Planctomycetota bacterium]